MMNWLRKRKPTREQSEELISVLERVKELCSGSGDSLWSTDSAGDLSVQMASAIQALRDGKHVSLKGLDILFLPTGSLQDTSIDNGWGDEFLELAERFDNIKKNWGQQSPAGDVLKAAPEE